MPSRLPSPTTRGRCRPKKYELTGSHREQLKIDVPFDIDIDISLETLKNL